MTSQRWRIDLEYDGTGFVGWQIQPNGPSIQEAIEDAIFQLCGERVRVGASGRTDAGVHAEQQVASFVIGAARSAKAIRDGLNAYLPPQIAVIAASAVPSSFDPRRDVKNKCYRYRWLDRPSRSPLFQNRAWHRRASLDVEAMNDATQHLVGTHDFSSFRAAGCQATHPVRTIHHAEVCRCGRWVELMIEGHGFLRHMVRIIAGTLDEVGRGRRCPHTLVTTIDARERRFAGKTAPACGLTLMWVRYPGP